MQRQQRLAKLAEIGDKAKKELNVSEQPTKDDVNRHKWKGVM